MKLKSKSIIFRQIALLLAVIFFSDGFTFTLALAQSAMNRASFPETAQRTIMEINDNGLISSTVPIQSSTATYLLTATLFIGIGLLAVYVYRKPSKQNKKPEQNETPKL